MTDDSKWWPVNVIAPEKMPATIRDLLAERSRLREALAWYEATAAHCRKITPEGEAARAALDRDGGNRARAALAWEPKQT